MLKQVEPADLTEFANIISCCHDWLQFGCCPHVGNASSGRSSCRAGAKIKTRLMFLVGKMDPGCEFHLFSTCSRPVTSDVSDKGEAHVHATNTLQYSSAVSWFYLTDAERLSSCNERHIVPVDPALNQRDHFSLRLDKIAIFNARGIEVRLTCLHIPTYQMLLP